ncbi:MAG: hemolysin family protein [Desulfobulbus sp.]|jgi:putative hemolysin
MDIVLLLVLIVLNGVFAMSEIAIISSREVRLEAMVQEGKGGSHLALLLKRNPGTFLSTIQVGITMVGILSGAIGENALIEPLAGFLSTLPLAADYSRTIALVVVVIGLTFLTVVIGELVPKHLGLLAPERAASLVARPMHLLARMARPLVWMFSAASSLILRLLGATQREADQVSNEEITLLMRQGALAGVFHESEQVLVSNVLRLDEQPVVEIMTHRQELVTLDIDQPEENIRDFLQTNPYSRIIACHGGLDSVAGLLRTVDLLHVALNNQELVLDDLLRPPLYVPEYVTTTQLMEQFRKSLLQCALVVDEYGDIQGFVTLTDVLAAIVGEVPSQSSAADPDFVRREDGSWLVDGGVSIERFKTVLDFDADLPGEGSGRYHTLAGLALFLLGRIPTEADRFEAAGWLFEVVDMDRNRVDKVLVQPRPAEEE